MSISGRIFRVLALKPVTSAGASMEPLESRVHLSLIPYKIGDPMPAARRYPVDNTDRVSLRNQLAGSTIGTDLAALNSASPSFAADFDNMLLSYMRSRSGPSYDFGPSDVSAIVNFVKSSTDPDQQKLYETEVLGTLTPAPGITPARPIGNKATSLSTLVEDGTSHQVYNFQLGAAFYPNFTPVEKKSGAGLYIDWLNPSVFENRNPATVALDLQRLPHLIYTAIAYRFLGVSGYASTIANTLYTWAGQAPPVSDAALLRLYKSPGSSSYTTNIPTNVRVSPVWGALDTGVRVYPLLMTYNLMLGTSAWTPELNTLFMVLMHQHGRVLGETAKAVYADETNRVLPGDSTAVGVNANPLNRTDNNKALQLCGALLTLARIFPEFSATKDTGSTPDKMGWTSAAKRLLKDALPRNYRGKYNPHTSASATWKFDGFHKEQSPNYAFNMADTFINQLKLSQINGGSNDPLLKNDPELRQLLNGQYVVPGANGLADPAGAIPVATRVEALYQIANPDGTAPTLGDTPRISFSSLFLRAQSVLPFDSYARNRNYTWPTKYPTLLDVFWLWKKNVQTVAQQRTYGALPVYKRAGHDAHVPATVSPENRPNSPGQYASWLPGAGYYMLRSDKGTRDDVQLTFDVGLMGVPNYNQNSNTAAHTQYDLLNFELHGYQRPMIEDPGLVVYGNSRERNWIATTVAHNSFTVDNYSHARMDGYFGVINPTEDSQGVRVTGFHYGYQKLDVDGSHPNGNGPALARTVWFDKNDTFLIVDWGHQTTSKQHKYKVSFTLPTPPTQSAQAAASKAAPVRFRVPGDANQGIFTDAAKGNVFILPLKPKLAAQKAGLIRGTQDAGGAVSGPFVTASNFSGQAAPAARLFATQTGNRANFVTLIHTYGDRKNKDQVVVGAVAEIISQSASAVTVRLTKNGIAKDITFANPFTAGQAPPLAKQAIPTRPTTVPSRSTHPATGGYPDLIETYEGTSPPDLNGGRFTIGTGDASQILSASVATQSNANRFSRVRILDFETRPRLFDLCVKFR